MTHGDAYADFYSNQIRQGADRGLIIAPGPDGETYDDQEGGIDFNGGSAFEEEMFGGGSSARDRLAHEWGVDTGFFPRDERPPVDTDSVMIAATGVAQALQTGDLDAASKLALQIDPRSIREAKFELFGVMADASPEKRQNLLRLAGDLKMLQRASFAFELIANGNDREGMFLLHQLLPEAGPQPGTDAGPQPDPEGVPSRTDGGTEIPLPAAQPETPPGTQPETPPAPPGLSPAVQDMIFPTQ